MNSITVKKEELLEALKKNQANHRSEFLDAQEGWKKVILESLEMRLADARAGRKYDVSFHYPEPQDHTKDYGRIIRMVEMEVEPTIEIGEHDFACYVMDDWEWKASWTASNVHYMTQKA